MEALISGVNWPAVIAGAVAAFAAGWLWYSPKMFATGWAEGVGVDTSDGSGPMLPAMIAQAASTFMLAWVIGITETTNSLGLAILIALTIAAIVKANGLFCAKSRYAIMVESGYIIVMVIIMIAAHALL